MIRKVLFLLFLSVSAKAQDPIVVNLLSEVSIDSLIYYASAISGEFPVNVSGTEVTIASRNKNFPGNAIAADYIQQKFNQFGLSTSVQPFGATGENVLATQPGVIFPNQKVILCGHYDSMPANGTASPAADDDGSGTAAVIEAARVMSHYQFAYTIVYAAWDEEEYGLVGANYYATQAENNGDSIVAVINVDAIAWDGDGDKLARVHVRNYANSVNLGAVAVNMIATYGIDLNVETNSPGATYSDHAAFWNHDFSAILLIEDFDNDGNPHYHTVTDRVEFFDTAYFGEISKWAFATAATMAVPLSGNVSVREAFEYGFAVYPNPVTNQLTIRMFEEANLRFNVSISDLVGRVVQSKSGNQFPVTLDLVDLPVGNYFLTLTDNSNGEILHSRPVVKD